MPSTFVRGADRARQECQGRKAVTTENTVTRTCLPPSGGIILHQRIDDARVHVWFMDFSLAAWLPDSHRCSAAERGSALRKSTGSTFDFYLINI
jgi:hypothetical protein